MGFAYIAGVVLSLMGFWNGVIYVVTSWRACQTMFEHLFGKIKVDEIPIGERRMSVTRGSRGGSGTGSWGDVDSLEGLAVERDRDRESV